MILFLFVFDNILVYSKSVEEHEEHVRKVLEILRQHKLYAKRRKCTFFTPQIEYLGFIVTQDCIIVDPAKVKDILEWPMPDSVKEIHGFLGITGWYRVFIKVYSLIATPLTNFLKKECKITWLLENQVSFDHLKAIISSETVLKLPNFNKPFEVSSLMLEKLALGGVLNQEEQPVAYTSRKLCSYELNYTTHDLELLVVMHALKLWRYYLLGCQFQLVIDHKILKWIFTQENLNMQQWRWIEALHEFEFDIKYRPQKENVVTDALSQKSFLYAISMPNNPILSKVKELETFDEYYQDLFKLVEDGDVKILDQGYLVSGDCLYFKDRLCIPH